MKYIYLLIILFSFSIQAHEYNTENVLIKDPWIKVLKKDSINGSAYMKIKNNNNKDIHIINIKSPSIKKITLHKTVIKNDVMTMRPHKNGIILKEGETMTFLEGGDHIMMYGFSKDLKNNELVETNIIFKKAKPIKVFFKVKIVNSKQKHNH